MGRREKPVPAGCPKPLATLARWLREQRRHAELSYPQMSRRLHDHPPEPGPGQTPCSADTLARAAAGHRLPRMAVVRTYALACGADPAEAERLWKRARYHQARAERGLPEALHINYVRNFAELLTALQDQYCKNGARPYQELEEASAGRLSHSTIARLMTGRTGRPSRFFVITFAEVCGLRGLALEAWGQAWDRAEEQRTGQAAPRPRRAATAEVPRSGRRPQPSLSGSSGPQETELFLDRLRLPDGQEVWLYRQPPGVPEGDRMSRLEELANGRFALTGRELEAARRARTAAHRI
ncbi:helix-turn-helix domain-containing protein [Streptomyces venezuelae]|uniref:helix-turn-helix domain-containing protein n=1 Tax=Streptomyces venezuelae TaxID=54571 RepID=UPI0036556558